MARPKKVVKPSVGFGDTVEKALELIGADKLAKFVLGEDCGCEERKAKLNAMFPYRKPECLTEQEYQYLTDIDIRKKNTFKPSEVTRIREIYSRVMKVRLEPSNCASCFKELVVALIAIYDTYEVE
jgi:uncharacterized protein YfkK (UPF0435 family)